jgi:rare lipoprotein A
VTGAATAATALVLVALAGGAARAESGIASVFCDRHTATGSMDCRAMVAAHRTARLGSTLHVCTASRCGSVRVVDRGPWVHGRVVDLSPGAARALGCAGLCRVTVD